MQEQPGDAPSTRTVADFAADIRERNPSLTEDNPVVHRLAFMYRVLAEAEAAYDSDSESSNAKLIIDYQKLSNDALRLERALGLLAPVRGSARPTGVPSARRPANADEREFS